MEEEKKVEEKKRIFGFRSQKKWKMAIAVLYYFIGIIMTIGIITDWSINVSVLDTIIVKITDFITLLIYLSPFLLLSDFSKDIRNKIPLLKENTKGKTILFFFIIIIITPYLTSIIESAHTTEFKQKVGIEQIQEGQEIKEEKTAEEKAEEERLKKEAEKAKKEVEEKAKKDAEEKAKKDAEEKAKKEAEEKAKKEAEAKAKKEAEEKAKKEAEAKAKKEKEEKAKAEKEHKEYIAKQKKERLANLKKIRKAYKENEIKADDTYKGNRYTVYAQFQTVKEDGLMNYLFNEIGVTATFKDGNTTCHLWCKFKKSEREKLKNYKKGDYILFSGECSNWGNWFECEIIE